MRKQKFEKLCEEVFVPRVTDILDRRFTELQETLDIISQELIRIDGRLDDMQAYIDQHETDEDNRC